MRFMLLLKANADTESGRLPDQATIAAMMKFNEEMVNAGVMLGGEGLQASAKGARVTFSAGQPAVTYGPFADTPGLICGFWIIRVDSLDEAIGWVRRCPVGNTGAPNASGGEIEIRRLFDPEDFAESDPTGELMAKENELRATAEALR